MNSTYGHRRINWSVYFLLIIGIWSLLFVLSYYTSQKSYRAEILEMARIQTQSAIDRDVLFRQWNAMLGGVYVKITDAQQPNPYLDVPERDVTTTSGAELTLINPSYMTRQIHELGTELRGMRGHMSSLTPLRPQNTPDPWERKGLESFQTDSKAISEVQEMDGQPYMRMIEPLTVVEGCLRCHATQGYEVGDIIGGLSVSVPMAPFLKIQNAHLRNLLLWHISVWFIGIAIMTYGAYRFSDQLAKRRRIQDKMRQQALHDSLTGLPNRRLFFDRLEQALKRSRRGESQVALLYIDLDGFKEVNDSFGHDTGDELLKRVSKTLIGCIREGDSLARLGGDEFCAILSHIESEDDASIVASRIVKALDVAFEIGACHCHIGASIGISIAPTDGDTSATLLKNADTAMYEVKKHGKGGFLRYS